MVHAVKLFVFNGVRHACHFVPRLCHTVPRAFALFSGMRLRLVFVINVSHALVRALDALRRGGRVRPLRRKSGAVPIWRGRRMRRGRGKPRLSV